jgi:hypothetical protein
VPAEFVRARLRKRLTTTTPSHERAASAVCVAFIQTDKFPYKFCLCTASTEQPVHEASLYKPPGERARIVPAPSGAWWVSALPLHHVLAPRSRTSYRVSGSFLVNVFLILILPVWRATIAKVLKWDPFLLAFDCIRSSPYTLHTRYDYWSLGQPSWATP